MKDVSMIVDTVRPPSQKNDQGDTLKKRKKKRKTDSVQGTEM